MKKNSQDFSMDEAMRLAQTPAGQQFLAMLQRADQTQLQKIATQAAAGDYESAARQLRDLLNQKGG